MKWSPEFELAYVAETTRESLLERHRHQCETFELDGHELGRVLEVGCGAAGGLFTLLCAQSEYWVAADPLMREYHKNGWLPRIFIGVDDYAHKLPFLPDQFDTLFCIETLDHCDSMEQFTASFHEFARVLKPGGALYFMLPPRDKPREGHPCCPDSWKCQRIADDAGFELERDDFEHKEGIWHLYRKR